MHDAMPFAVHFVDVVAHVAVHLALHRSVLPAQYVIDIVAHVPQH